MYNQTLISQDYLIHHGVKGMKWGVRHEPERSPQRMRTKAAKANFKSAARDYSKAYNKWYYSSYDPRSYFTEKGRHKYEQNTLAVGHTAAKRQLALGKYQQAKGIEKNKPKLVAKGKRRAELAANTTTYYSAIKKSMDAGYSYNDSVHRNRKTYDRLRDKEIDIKAKYRRQYGI